MQDDTQFPEQLVVAHAPRVTQERQHPGREHPVRLRTDGGVSYLRSFWVGPYPTVFEAKDDTGSPQRIEAGVTVQGVIDTEDEDAFVVGALLEFVAVWSFTLCGF